MTKAAREWMLCATERGNTKFAVYKFGGMKGRTGCVRGRETSLQDKAQIWEKRNA